MAKHTIEKLSKKYIFSGEDESDLLKKSLLKKAKGFVLEEISEEYVADESDKLRLSKRKVISKEVAPETNALKALIELNLLDENKYKKMTNEELIKEKNRLLNLLEEEVLENEFDKL